MKRFFALLLVATVLLFFGVPIMISHHYRDAHKRLQMSLVNDAQVVKVVADEYAIDHDGKYPESIAYFIPEYIPAEIGDIENNSVRDRLNRTWVYLGAGQSNTSLGTEAFLTLQDFNSEGSEKKFIVRVDSSVNIARIGGSPTQ